MGEYFPKPLRSYSENIKVRVDLSNYATKADIKNITHVDTSGFALKTNLANLKTEVDKLDTDKLKTIPVNLSKLSNVVKNEVVKKNTYDKLVAKVNKIDASGFLLKTKYDADKSKLDNKIPDTSNFVKKTDYNTKIIELENKILDITNLATKTTLTTVENKIRNISNLATKSELNTVENKIPDISDLAIKTLVNKVENKIPDISNLATKTLVNNVENKIPDISNLVKKSGYNTKITEVENNVKKLHAYDLSYYRGKKYFVEEDGVQNYLVFLPMRKYLN